jgi:exosortase A-associated hydrolase 1
MLEERALAFRCQGDTLYGILSLPAQPHPRGVLVIVGGPQYRAGSHRQFTLLARALAAAGIPAMRFDYRGMGDSEGAPRGFEQVQDDIRAAIDGFVAETPGLSEVVLWGLCDGATAAAMYAPLDARVTGLALLNPWVRTEQGAARATIRHYYLSRLLDRGFWRKLLRGGVDWRTSASSLAGMTRSAVAQEEQGALPDRMLDALRRFTGRTMVVLSGADLTAQEFAGLPARSKAWAGLLAAPRFVRHELAGADHTFSRREWHEQVTSWTKKWLRSW